MIYKFDQYDVYSQGIFDQYDAVFLSGGDTEQFWNKLVQTHTHQALQEFVKRWGVLIGVSAGSMIMMSHILLSNEKTLWLGLIPGYFHPHYDINDLEKLLLLSREKYSNMLYCLSDDSYLEIDGTEQKIYGAHTLIQHGTIL